MSGVNHNASCGRACGIRAVYLLQLTLERGIFEPELFGHSIALPELVLHVAYYLGVGANGSIRKDKEMGVIVYFHA